jgi:ubiquinone biosynthesis protein
LLQKTLLNVEGLGRQLYPELDIWQTATPVLRRWMRERVSPRNVLRELRRGFPDALDVVKALPQLARRAVELAQDGQLRVPVDTQAIDELRTALSEQSRRSDRILIGAVLLLGAVLWFGLRLYPRWFGAAVGAAGLISWISAWLQRRL